MIKNNRKYLIGLIVMVIMFISAVMIRYENIGPSAMAGDIEVEGVLELNNTGIRNDKEYVLNIKMTKNKNCHIITYPYIDGLGYMTFNEGDKENYYVPGSIGSDGVTEPIGITALKNNNIIANGTDISLYGFWFPDEAGQYKARMYFNKLDTFKEIKNPVLVCVYTEEKYGKQLTWSKIIPISIQ